MMNYITRSRGSTPTLWWGEVEIAHWMVMVAVEIFPRSLLPEEGWAAADMTKITCVQSSNDNAFFNPERRRFQIFQSDNVRLL